MLLSAVTLVIGSVALLMALINVAAPAQKGLLPLFAKYPHSWRLGLWLLAMLRFFQRAVKVKDNSVAGLLVFPVLRDPLVWMIPLTTATPRKVVSIVVDFANASTVVQFSAAVFLVLLGSNTPRRVSAVLSAEPAIMVAIR
jgi:hypothetical protein